MSIILILGAAVADGAFTSGAKMKTSSWEGATVGLPFKARSKRWPSEILDDCCAIKFRKRNPSGVACVLMRETGAWCGERIFMVNLSSDYAGCRSRAWAPLNSLATLSTESRKKLR